MEKKRTLGITIISLYIILLPLILFFIVRAIILSNISFSDSPAHPFRFLYSYVNFGQSWRTDPALLILEALLGIGVFYRKNAARLGAIALTGFKAILGAISLITISLNVSSSLYNYILKTYGRDDTFLPLLIFTVFILGNAFVVFYLTRPKVREQFK